MIICQNVCQFISLFLSPFIHRLSKRTKRNSAVKTTIEFAGVDAKALGCPRQNLPNAGALLAQPLKECMIIVRPSQVSLRGCFVLDDVAV